MAKTSERIKEALQIRNMKQSELVEKTKIGKSSISTYLSGTYEPKQKNIYLIAKALKVSPAWLMGLDVPMEDKSNPSSEQSFLTYLNSLGYSIYRDDPEHRPIMGIEEFSCVLKYDTLDLLKLRVDSYTRATVDSELLALREEELKNERLKKERIAQHLLKTAQSASNSSTIQNLEEENIHKGSLLEKDWNATHLEPKAAHLRTDIDITEEMRKHDDDIMNNDDFWK